MGSASGRLLLTVLVWCCLWSGCSLPTPPPPPLSAAAAQYALDQWNPSYCKVVEFYGFHQPGENVSDTLEAYVLLANPSDASQKQAVYVAVFHLLARPDGKQQWFLTALTTHASGLTRRQGWDNLFIPVRAVPPPSAKEK